jgi:membrane protein implicated in regulation of membrane protease activity
MDAQRWLLLAIVVIIVAVIVYRRFQRTQEQTEHDRRISGEAQEQAQLPGDRISQREDRRLGGMTAEDRAWEQSSLQRNRESQERIQPAGHPEDHR